MSPSPIPYFDSINEFLAGVHSKYRTINDNLFCLRIEDTFPDTVDVMPPFRKGFYFISLVTDMGSTRIGYDATEVDKLNTYLVFQSPGHVFSWHRDRNVRGYLVYFKKECFQFFRPAIETEFPFFDLLHTNFFAIRSRHFDTFAPLLEDVFAAYQRFPQANQPPVAALKLLAVLYQFRAFVADLNHYDQRFVTPEKRLFSQYVQLVNNYYLDKRTVEEYAHLLNITPHHLSESVKLASNQNALQVINQKVLAEAKIMLRYTQSDIAEVAYGLNFSDPANFGRFFKKLTGQTPLEYRRTGG